MNKSVYDSPTVSGTIKRHLIAILVDNEPGVLARVVGMFSGRGYNIDSLNVAEVVTKEHLSRITIVTHGTNDVVELIRKQLMTIVPVHSVTNLEEEEGPVEAEVALVYLDVNDANKKNVLNICDIYRARKIENEHNTTVFVVPTLWTSGVISPHTAWFVTASYFVQYANMCPMSYIIMTP